MSLTFNSNIPDRSYSDYAESIRLDLASLRTRISERPLQPFEFLEIVSKPNLESAIASANGLLEDGWSLPNERLNSINPPLKWEGYSRSFEFHLHAWLPVQRLLIAFDLSSDRRYFDAALAMALDWLHTVKTKPTGRSLKEASAEVLSKRDSCWWYDMAIAQRLQRLSYIVDVACRLPDVPDYQIVLMIEQIMLHHAVLQEDGLFRAETNHGFFQALNQLAATRRFPELDPTGEILRLCQSRMEKMLIAQFTDGMVHKEHSPGYHLMVTMALVNAHRSGVLNDDFSARLKTAMATLGWMISPSGALACFGDSDPRRMFNRSNIEFLADERSLAETLRQTDATPIGVRLFLDPGYAFARLYAPQVDRTPANASYLAQIAAFHSRVHKHADHLSFIWYDQGRDILIDSGRYAYTERTLPRSELFEQGFWYSDPKRIYVESTRAHNCVEIDGKSYPRKDVKPFGSALLYAGEQNGLAVTGCEVRHPGGVRHRRVLVMAPGRFLLTLDFLLDRRNHHDYRQWFQFAPEWQLESGPDGVTAQAAALDDKQAAGLRVFNLLDENRMGRPVRGQEEPHLQGWHSDAANSLIPSASLAVEAADRKIGRFATFIVLDDGATVNKEATRFNVTLRHGAVSWTDRHGSHVLVLTLDEDGTVQTLLGGPELAGSAAVRSIGNKRLRRGFLQRILHYLRP